MASALLIQGSSPGSISTSLMPRAGAGDRGEDRDADPGEGAGDGELLAPPDARAHAADDGAALDHDERIAGVAGLQPRAVDPLDVKDLDAGSLERAGQPVMLGLHRRHVRRRVAL